MKSGLAALILFFVAAANAGYVKPDETCLHSATWLQWPNDYGWDATHVARYQATWIAMTKALAPGERVHLIVYNDSQQAVVAAQLAAESVPMDSITFHVWKTDDVWIRDNGPMFVFDDNGNPAIIHWNFNGWGGNADSSLDRLIPDSVGKALGIPVIEQSMTLEGGAVEVDSDGTFMGKKSCILNSNRNPGLTQQQADSLFTQFLGVSNFIWMPGVAGQDITDDHIDGTATFAPNNTIVFNDRNYLNPGEYDTLLKAVNRNGNHYNLVEVPLTKSIIPTAKFNGIYVNYYVANKVVLVPTYNDANDSSAKAIIQNIYPDRKVIGIDATQLYADGGMIHCVTQQQPAARNATSISHKPSHIKQGGLFLQQHGHSMRFSSPPPAGIRLSLFTLSGERIPVAVRGRDVVIPKIATGTYLYFITGSNISSMGKIVIDEK